MDWEAEVPERARMPPRVGNAACMQAVLEVREQNRATPSRHPPALQAPNLRCKPKLASLIRAQSLGRAASAASP